MNIEIDAHDWKNDLVVAWDIVAHDWKNDLVVAWDNEKTYYVFDCFQIEPYQFYSHLHKLYPIRCFERETVNLKDAERIGREYIKNPAAFRKNS